jgi:hypothetical protein
VPRECLVNLTDGRQRKNLTGIDDARTTVDIISFHGDERTGGEQDVLMTSDDGNRGIQSSILETVGMSIGHKKASRLVE